MWGFRSLSRIALAAPLLVAAAPLHIERVWDGRPIERRDAATFRAVMTQTHDRARASFGLAPLAWDDVLAREALAYAATLAAERRFEHAERVAGAPVEGENLWMGTRGAFRYAEMTGAWIDEGRDFAPGRFPNISRTGSWHDVGHYTQIIWAETKRVGCGMAANAGDEYLVCRYFPAGNVMGRDPLTPQPEFASRGR